MTNDDALIEKSDIPELLKDYLLRNNRYNEYVTKEILTDIEDVFVEYDSLYIFNQSEFCSYIITSIRKQEKYDYFYHYLKKIFSENLKVIPKHKLNDEEEVLRIKNILNGVEEWEIPKYLMDIMWYIDEFKESGDQKFIYSSYKLIGVLQVLFELYPNHSYKTSYKKVCEKLYNLDK